MVAEATTTADPRLRIAAHQNLGAVRMMSNGQLVLTWGVARRLTGRHVVVLDRGCHRFGLFSVDRMKPGAHALRLMHRSGGTCFVSGNGILKALGRTRPSRVIDLPYRWDEANVLVVNVSALDRSEVHDRGR